VYITEIRIRNYRNFLKARLVLKQGVNTLIGENGSGKTNAFQAMRLLLDESLSRNALVLAKSDFCRDLGPWQGEWIIISADFADLDAADGCQILRHNASHVDGTNTGTYTFSFRPRKEVRIKLHELSENETAKLAGFIASITIDDYEPFLTGRGAGDFLDDNIYTSIVGNRDTGEYPNPENDDQAVIGVHVGSIYQEVACTFVRALRDVVSELRGYRNNPLITLLRGKEKDVTLAEAEAIIAKVDDLNTDISGLQEIQTLAEGIETALRKTVGLTYGPGVTIESALPNSLEKILQRLNVLVGDQQHSNHRGEIQEQSLGGANLIYLSLKFLEYEIKLSSDRVAHFLLIEEPEAHIHTHIQKTLFTNLPTDRTQVIVSTHSTQISSASRIASVNVMAKQNDHVEVFQPANGLDAPTIARVERYLDAVRSTMLFAKGVLLVEGDAEKIMIPAMLQAIFGLNPDQLGFSIVSMDSAFFEHVSIVFADERIRRPCAIVTDLDASIFDLPENSEDDDKRQAHASAAELDGLARQGRLNSVANDNRWLVPHYADHTFEIDFCMVGNALEIIETLPQIYTNEKRIERSTDRLKSKDVDIYGKEVIRLANKVRKGWFALLLAENLSNITLFPEYILRAIAFSCHLSISDSVLQQIALHRMDNDTELAERLRSKDNYKELSSMSFLKLYCDEEPDDQLTFFHSCIHELKQE